jgi:hypothetical protein
MCFGHLEGPRYVWPSDIYRLAACWLCSAPSPISNPSRSN